MVAGLGLLAVSAVLLTAGAELFTENAAVNRPGFGGDSEPIRRWSHASTEEVSG